MIEAEAYLFKCWKPGKSCVFASVDPDTSEWWNEDWEMVWREPLTVCGPSEIIHQHASKYRQLEFDFSYKT